MTIQKWLLLLYPRVWRTRYEEEFLVTLSSHPFSLPEGMDILLGALDAHLHPSLGTTALPLPEKMKHLLSTIRCSLVTLFCTYSSFILAGLAFQKMTEERVFQQAGQGVNLVGISFQFVIFGAIVALLAVLVGGLPIAIATIRSALVRKRYGPLFLLAVPILAFLVFLRITLFLEAINRPGTQPIWQFFLHRGVFFGTLLAAAIASPSAICFAVIRSEIPEKLLRFALFPFALGTLSMALVLAAIIVWGLGLREVAPQLFAGNDGIVSTSTIGTWLGIVIAMGIATVLAALSLIRGLSARSALRNGAA
ncbi:MAG: hypothetical protein JO031_03710 [Ktedonobacteraceae bacterium]|nr:hypothetical protein [Ktedonobacteraceae bacterium]